MTSVDRPYIALIAGTASAVLVLFCATFVAGCAPATRLYEFTGPTMGTEYHIKIVSDAAPEAVTALQGEIDALLAEVNRLMSTYDPDSELSQFNRSESTEPFALSPRTLGVLNIAREIHTQSNGALDVTVGPIVNAYGFGPESPARPPSEAELDLLRTRVGQNLLTLTDTAAAKARPDVYVDLSAVAKGYGVDEVADFLKRKGYVDHMVEIGGEVRARGLNAEGRPWRIAIEKPIDEGRAMHRAVSLRDASMATSGDYRNFYMADGQRISHTIDPRTGHPIAHHLASVSVIHADCVWADGYATALNVLGPEEGPQLAESLGLAALFLVREEDGSFREIVTPKMNDWLHGMADGQP